jgi:hypothetical protein
VVRDEREAQGKLTQQGEVLATHLDVDLDEYTFRLNRRSAKARGLLFYRLIEQPVPTEPPRYRWIVGGNDRPDHNIQRTLERNG